MQIHSAVCDVHQSHPLNTVCTISGTIGTDPLTLEAMGNIAGECDRYYEPSRGYFTVEDNGRFRRGNPNVQPHCREHYPKIVFMYVTAKDGEPVWACPECGNTQNLQR